MSISSRVIWYLGTLGVDYEIIHHPRTRTSLGAAESAHVPANRVAKCILLEDEIGYLLAVLPASEHVDLDAIDGLTHRRMCLAGEPELERIFGDCELGAVPPTGVPYNIPTLVDEQLLGNDDLYFEAGGHEDLVHVDRSGFRRVVGNSIHGRIGSVH